MNKCMWYAKTYGSPEEAEEEFSELMSGPRSEFKEYVHCGQGSDGRFTYLATEPREDDTIISIKITKSGAEADLDKPCDLEVWLIQNGFTISKNS